jgi:hypothetical protein
MAVSRRQITYNGGERYVDVEVTVIGHDLTKGEIEQCADGLADEAMRMINTARYINAPLSKIKAQRKRK